MLSLFAASTAAAGPLGTAFSYQGQLNSGGLPAAGQFDLQFKLFDASANGTQKGPTITFDDVNIAEGLFTVELDFGANVFDGNERWLEIGVRPGASGDPFTPLSPRQHVTASPYALYALNSGDAGATTLDEAYDGGGSGLGRTITADAGAVAIVGGQDSEPGSGGFVVLGSVSGANLSLDNNEIMARSNGAVATLSLNNDGGNVVVGGGSADSRMLINRTGTVSGAEYFGVFAPTSGNNYGGMYLQTNTSGKPFYGYDSGSQTCWTYLDGETGDWHVHNGGDYLTVTDGGRVGVGITAPEATFHAYNGSGTALKVEGFGGGEASEFYGGQGTAIYAESNSKGVFGKVKPGWNGYGIYGEANDDNGGGAGVHGFSFQGKGVYGYDYASSGGGVGVYGRSDSSGGYGVYCKGDFGASGSKAFAIDHPLDPANKILKHYCPEGPEPMLVYSGNAVMNDKGEAVVELPDYFDTINKDLRYQLTCVGGFAQVYVAEEVRDNQFRIAGGKPGMKVSWQVSGVRNDRYMQVNNAPTVIEKVEARRGMFISPELYGDEYAPSYYGLTTKPQGENGTKSE